jgi:hypothetical protein
VTKPKANLRRLPGAGPASLAERALRSPSPPNPSTFEGLLERVPAVMYLDERPIGQFCGQPVYLRYLTPLAQRFESKTCHTFCDKMSHFL